MTAAVPSSDRPIRGTLISLAFWLCLFASLLMYAAVTLAPRIVEWSKLTAEYAAHQGHMLAVQEQIRHLQKVVAALEHDPAFVMELARHDFDAAREGDLLIAVNESLGYDARIPRPTRTQPQVREPWCLPLMNVLAARRELRNQWLSTAAGVLLFAFIFLNDGPLTHAACGYNGVKHVLRRATARYRRSH